MGKLKILAGDFLTLSPSHQYSAFLGGGGGEFHLATEARQFKFINTETIPATELVFLSLANEEAVKKLGGTVAWGAAGGLLLGPVGLLAGLLLGGKQTTVTFIAKFKDGRKLIASTDPKTWTQVQAGGLHLL